MEIWVNPALDEPPSLAQLEDVLGRLALEPWDITRTNEPDSVAVEALPRTAEGRGQWLQALVDHPRLIQRPIITADDGTTVIGRDQQSLAHVLGSWRRAGPGPEG